MGYHGCAVDRIDIPLIRVKFFSPAAEFKDSLACGSSIVGGAVRVMVGGNQRSSIRQCVNRQTCR